MTFSVTATCALCNAEFEARTSYGLCANCATRDALREFDRVESARRHAQRVGLPERLHLTEWLSTVSDHQGKCGFCLLAPYSLIHMVNPSKGLIWENVVPCCRVCEYFTQFSWAAAVERVQIYLESDQGGNEEEGEEVQDDGSFSSTEHVPVSQFMAELFALEPWRIGNPQLNTGGEPA